MIHELIDSKQKSIRTNATKNTKPIKDDKSFFEVIAIEHSENEHKEVESSSTTFLPPWLRNSLGLNQRSNQSHANSNQKPVKTFSSLEQQNELETLKPKVDQDCCKKPQENYLRKDCVEEIATDKDSDVAEQPSANYGGKIVPTLWSTTHKESETESTNTNAEVKILKRENSKMTNTDVTTSIEIDKIREDERRRLRLARQKNKIRKRLMTEQKDLDAEEVNFLLEMKAREVLDNYMKKDIHSVSSDMKQLEAKLILLSAKCHDVGDSKLTQQEIRLLQEIKNQAGNKEGFDKLMKHVKESNLREILRNSESVPKGGGDKLRKDELKEDKSARDKVRELHEEEVPGDKDSLISTDDENDIKRFSEFLSKNKNMDEKRKCLEEVRNYFERKRRTRLTKRRYMDDTKLQRHLPGDKKDEPTRDKLKGKETYNMLPEKDKKSKFGLLEEEVVEKAVNETLQKFVDLYHFHVTPSLMGSMRKNILQAIQSDSMENKLSERQSVGHDGKMGPIALDGKKVLKVSQPSESIIKRTSERKRFTDDENATGRESSDKETKKRSMSMVQAESPTKELNEVSVRNENIQWLKNEIDSYLNSGPIEADFSGLKLQSVILEKEENEHSKSQKYAFNFSKKSLEVVNVDGEAIQVKTDKVSEPKNVEVQTSPTTLKEEMKSTKTQTISGLGTFEQCMQTDEKVYVSAETQTETADVTLKELKELSNFDVCPGLYRMIRSKEAGRFYLYPESLDGSKDPTVNKKSSSLLNSSDLDGKLSLAQAIFGDKALKPKQASVGDKINKAIINRRGQSKPDVTNPEEEDQISCLYFRNSPNKTSAPLFESLSTTKEVVEEVSVEIMKKQKQENQKECALFWNGQKINPGCDLKTHVEDLLKEKLKDIITPENPDDQSLTADNVDKDTASLNEQDNLAAVIHPEDLQGEAGDSKLVRDVATQNSQQVVPTLDMVKVKSRSTSSVNIQKVKKRNVFLKSVNAEDSSHFTSTADIVKAVRELKKMKLEVKRNGREGEVTLDSSSTLEDTSSSMSKNYAEDPLTILLGLPAKKEEKGDSSTFDMKTKLEQIMGLVDNEAQTNEDEDDEVYEKKPAQGQGPDSEGHKHWELIENVLNRVNQKEREGLWNDIREFVKMKIGRDINDDGAKEVCIEIEQDVPKNSRGKTKPVLARGHYSRNEGDVEVEIDLTLEDLERILRHRQRKYRRRQLGRCNKSRRLVSSSSAQSDCMKEDLRRYQNYLHRFTALGGGFVTEKELKMLTKKQR